jgi:site-specific DNA-methyltransferase (adenine-specific)
MIDLQHGDCLEAMKSIPDGSVDMILCDLPYGTTACKWDTLIPFESLWVQYKRVLNRNGAVVLFGSQPFTSALVLSNPRWFKYEWIWEKNRGSNFATTKYMPMKEHENVLVFCEGRTQYNPIKQERAEGGKSRAGYKINASNTGKREVMNGLVGTDTGFIDPNLRAPRSVQKFNTEVGLHPTQKPVTLCEYLIRTYTNEGEVVLDNCMGSGTTGVACVNTNRKFIGIEKDETYFKIAEQRIAVAAMGDLV